MNQYTVLGRKLPSEKCANPEVFRMTIFAPNDMVAESRFWYHINQLQKIKKSHGQTISVQKVVEDDSVVKNFAIQIRYRDAIGHKNMYREVRETTAARAMAQLYSEMAGQYHIRYQDIQIVKYEEIKKVEDIRREKVLMMMPAEHHEVKFPHPFANAAVKRQSKNLRFAKKIPTIDV